ncbi:hypothetical protein G7068_06600 [Leucobacter viscericola]|uniref:SLH domain-containing protein n=1 Tax=Leucobacter viscericola TaxID=2714935 RepID=A0A6G7XE87_9MICO|nr:Ig-like domain repeat protein [Leucobacter viscericola]QIK62904.1 hypothetical protein G7068_06600 [Leucobacter viscericola]
MVALGAVALGAAGVGTIASPANAVEAPSLTKVDRMEGHWTFFSYDGTRAPVAYQYGLNKSGYFNFDYTDWDVNRTDMPQSLIDLAGVVSMPAVGKTGEIMVGTNRQCFQYFPADTNRIRTSTCDGSAAQQFDIVDTGNGNNTFYVMQGGLYLTDMSGFGVMSSKWNRTHAFYLPPFSPVADSTVSLADATGTVGDVSVTYGQAASVSVPVTDAPPYSSIVVSVDGVAQPAVKVNTTTPKVTLPAGAYPAGEHDITASLVNTGDNSTVYAISSAKLRVAQAASTTSLELGEDFVSVTGKVAGQYGTIPTGTVTLTFEGKTVGTATLAADGTYSTTLTGWSATGILERDLIANYAGDTNHTASSVTVAVPANHAEPTVTLGDGDGKAGDVTVTYGQPAKIGVAVTDAPANSSVVVWVDGLAQTPVALTGTTATITVPAGAYTAGDHKVTMTLVDAATGSTLYASGDAKLIVKQATTKTTVALNKDQKSVAGKVTAQYGTIPTGTVTLTFEGKQVGTATVAKDGSYKATLTGWTIPAKATKRTLLANYAGDKNHVKSTVSQVVTVDGSKVPGGLCSAPRPIPVFADTPLAHKFYKEIDWMECMKYSTGWRQPVGKPLYKPADNLERQAMAAFIFRMEAPKSYKAPAVSPFADVKPGDSYYKEIAWMYEAKLSTGYKEAAGKPTFRPHDSLSREAMAAFIYRLEAPKNYKAPAVSPMADMKPGMSFYKEISWMYDVKLSTGNKTATGKEYWPKDNLSRQAMAAFIYRLVLDYRA